MKKPIIAVDIDDVLAETTDALRIMVNERFDVDLQTEHYRIEAPYWGYYEHIWAGHGIEAKLEDFQPSMILDQSFVRAAEGSVAALRQISRDYEIVALTARHDASMDATLRWLDDNFTGLISKVKFIGSKDGLKMTKGDACLELGAVWLIDDHVEHAQSALEKGVQVILYGDYGWHQNIPSAALCCKTWQEVAEYFEQ